MSMRYAILAAATAVITAGLVLTAGCAPDSSPSGGTAPSVDGKGPITFAVGSDDADIFKNLIKPWNLAHPTQQVTLTLLPEAENGQLAQLTANLQAGSSTYDVIAMDVIWTAEFAAAGWIIPLESSTFPLGDFLRPAVDTAMYNGHLWAVPYYSNAEVLYYRKDILGAAGKLPPKTWAQLAEQAETVAPKYGLQGYAGQLAPYEGLTVNFADAIQSAGGSILSPAGNVTVNSPQARAGLSFLVNGLHAGWIDPSSLDYEEESSGTEFQSGKLLFLNNWPFIYGQAQPARQQGLRQGRRSPAARARRPGVKLARRREPGRQRVLQAPGDGHRVHQLPDQPARGAAASRRQRLSAGVDIAVLRPRDGQAVPLPARGQAGHPDRTAAALDRRLRPGQPGDLQRGLPGADQ